MRPRRINALFVCSRNQGRSPTAERIWRDSAQVNVRARGLSPAAPRVLRDEDLGWADIVFVMESRHRRKLLDQFGDLVEPERIVVLEIPDDYQFMDPELIELLEARAGWHLDQRWAADVPPGGAGRRT